MTSIGAMDQFDIRNPGSWDSYSEQLKFFLEANSINSNEKKRAVLLAVCGIKTLSILRSLIAPDLPSSKSFDEILLILKNHFSPVSSEIYCRFQFHKRLQLSNESVNTYVTELRRLAENCNFGATLTERLRDQLVCGLRDEHLQRRLLAESFLTFNDAFAKAVAAEMASEQAKQIHLQKTPISTNLISTPSNGNRTAYKKSGTHAKSTNEHVANSCLGCGGNHNRSICKFKDAICRHCKKKGHIERVCKSKTSPVLATKGHDKRKKPATHAITETTYNSDVVYNVRESITKTEGIDKLSVSLYVNNVHCVMEVDSGSNYTIISSQEFERIWPRNDMRLSPIPFKLCDYQHSPIALKGQCIANVHLGNFNKKLRLLVADGRRANLLGLEWFKPLGINIVGIHHTFVSMDNLLTEFKDVFSEKLGSYNGPKISLPIDPKARPIVFKPRNIPIAMKGKVDIALDKLLRQEVIEPISNPKWGTPIVPVSKTNGEIRLCADYKVTINKAMKDHPYPIPSVNHILASLADAKFFAKIDLAQAYLQLEVDDASAEAQTIITHRGAFRVKRLQFGVNVAPGIFQNFIEDLLRGIPGVMPYFDDVLIFADSENGLVKRLREVLIRLSKSGIKANKDKCIFNTNYVDFLGYRIDASGIHPSESKVKAIHDAPRPRNKTELQAFLGLLNFYHSFLHNKSTVAEPLHRLLDKNSIWKWTKEHDIAFIAVKKLLSSNSVLTPFNEKLPIVLTCDASPYGVGYVLSHVLRDGREAPIAFASKTLTSTERNYSQLDKEALAIISGIKKFHYFLYGHKFTLVTDHQPLLGLFNKMKLTPDILSPRMLRWSQMLNAYDFTIVHRPGRKIQNADALSRLPLRTPNSDTPPPYEVLFLEELSNPPVKASEIAKATLKDPILSRVQNWVLKGWTDDSKDIKIFYTKRNELSMHKNCLLWGCRVVIPKPLQQRVLEELHLAHPGVEKMKALARSYVWWQGIDEDIENFVGCCEPCQLTRHAPPRAPIHPWEVTTRPWSRLHIDFAGPFQGQMFFVLVDSFSKWLEVRRISSATSDATIKLLREIFATHGIPDSIVSDNGSQFTSFEFKNFMEKNGIHHILTAPYHPSSNGQAERVVQTTKDALKRIINGSWNQRLTSFLLSQHITPSSSTGLSPAELLMKRKLRTVLDLLHPDLIQDRRKKNELAFEKSLSSNAHRVFAPNDSVYVKNYSSGQAWLPATVIEVSGPLSYKVTTLDGKVVRCHVDQMRNRKVSNSSASPSSETSEEPTTTLDFQSIPIDPPTPSSQPCIELASPPDKELLEETPSDPPVSPPKSRPRRKITRPLYLKDYVV